MPTSVRVRGSLATSFGAALAIVIALGAAPSRAEQTSGASAPAEPNLVATDVHPWTAVGKLNNGIFGACTAVLISNEYALTAAHCLYFRLLRRFLPAEAIHVVLGYDNQRLGENYRVVAYYVPPAYDPRKPGETIANDWALLQVASDAKQAARPVAVAHAVDLSAQIAVMTGGYSSRRQHKMSADTGCRIIGSSADEKLLFDTCRAPDGFSGGPVFAGTPDRKSFSLLGIHVASQVWQGQPITIAISATAIWPEIRTCVESHKCRFQHLARTRDPTAAEIFAGLPNLGLRKVVDMVADQLCPGDHPQCGLPHAAILGLEEPTATERGPAPTAER